MAVQLAYAEGPEITEKFEQTMKLLFQTPKPEAEPKKQRTRVPHPFRVLCEKGG